MSTSHKIQWVARETVRYEDGPIKLDLSCYFDPNTKSYTAILGSDSDIATSELERIESRIKDYLSARWFLGFRVGSYGVHVIRSQHAA